MAKPAVLVSYAPESAHREKFRHVLSKVAETAFLPDLPESSRDAAIERADVVITWNLAKEFSADEFVLLKTVRLIQLVTAGADHLPFGLLPGGPLIASNPGAYAAPMAEHILGMALALAKRFCTGNARLKAGEFDQKTRNKYLRGLTFGVLGFGGIGQAASDLMRGLGMKIFALNTSGRTDEPVDFIGTLGQLDHILKNSDVLLVSIPLVKSTRDLIGSRELGLMKPDAIIINVARGAIIDEGALYAHLKQNPDFGAGIDAWWIEPAMNGEFKVHYPFFDLPNFLGTPHNSSAVPGILTEAVGMASENVNRFLRDEKIRGVVKREDYV